MTTIKGSEARLGQVLKIDGRWCRLVKWDTDIDDILGRTPPGPDQHRYVIVAAPTHDPRMALLPGATKGRSVTGRSRSIYPDREYVVIDVPAPAPWEWVSRKLAENSRGMEF